MSYLAEAFEPAKAMDMLTSPRRLRAALIDPHLRTCPSEMLNVAARMILVAENLGEVLEVALDHLCRSLGAARADAGLGAPGERLFVSTSEFVVPGSQARSVTRLAIPNTHWVPQTAWRSPIPLEFDVENDPRCASLRRSAALSQSRLVLVGRMAVAGEPFGLVCVDQVDDRHAWTAGDNRHLDELVGSFVAPLAWLHVQARRAARSRPPRAELEAVRCLAQGLSYKATARRLGKSVRTVNNQLASARARCGVHNEVDLITACRAWL